MGRLAGSAEALRVEIGAPPDSEGGTLEVNLNLVPEARNRPHSLRHGMQRSKRCYQCVAASSTVCCIVSMHWVAGHNRQG